MALFHPVSAFSLVLLVFLSTLLSLLIVSHQQQPLLSPAEQDAVYRVLHSVNPTIAWRSLFSDDLCSSAPHGVVCDYFSNNDDEANETVHVTELSFGYVSDYAPNPPCSLEFSALDPLLFTSFKFLRKLFFYKCFNNATHTVSFPHVASPSFLSTLEELVFVDNPSLVGPLSGVIRNYSSLRRVVMTGNGFYGDIPNVVGDLVKLDEITLSRNQLSGGVPSNLAKLKSLKVLDLSHNHFDGDVPDTLGNLTELLKLDLGYNALFGKIPEGLKNLQSLEFLDLSYNHFGNFGVPLILGEMPRLKEVYLSGNLLGGQIPEIWEELGSVVGIGLSNAGLVGKIPASMGVHLRNLCYLGLDNNYLEGTVPVQFGLLESVCEINLENNNLSGRVPFSAKFPAKFGGKLKLKLAGNPELCVDEGLGSNGRDTSGQLKVCSNKRVIPNAVLFTGGSNSQLLVPHDMLLLFLGFLFIFCCINS